MIKKVLPSIFLLFGLLAGLTALASPASADPVERCSKPSPTDVSGVTIVSCIYIDGSNGRATARVTWGPGAPNTVLRPVVTIVRNNDGVEVSQKNNNCPWVAIGSGTSGGVSCNAYLTNLSGNQAWRSDAQVYVYLADDNPFLRRSQTIYG